MNGKFKAALSALLTAAMLFGKISVGADDTEAAATPESQLVSDELIIADFDNGADGFRKGDNVKALETVTTYDGSRYCLEVMGYDVDVGLARNISAKFGSATAGSPGTAEGLDLSEYQGLSYDIYIPAYDYDPEAEYFVQTTLRSADGTSTGNITKVEPDSWTTISFEIASWKSRSALSEAEISLMISTNEAGLNRNTFYIDELRADNRIDREHTERFMIDDFTVTGGTAAYDDRTNRLIIAPNENEPTVLSAVAFPTVPDWKVDSLRLRIENNSDIDSLTINYSTYDTSALSEDKSVTLKLDRQSPLKTYYVDVGDISKLRSLSFVAGEGSGSISISSICAVSRYVTPEYQTCGNITGCILTDNLLSIRFTGDVGREEALSNQSGTLKIFATEPGTDPDRIDISSLEPVAQSPMTTKFDLTVADELQSVELFTKQFIAFSVRPDGSRVLIDAPFYLDDIGRSADYSVVDSHGEKGVILEDISRLNELRADVTMLNVDMTKAFAARGKGMTYVYGGSTYYIDAEYFGTLGRQIEALHGAGVGVILRLVGWSEEYEEELAGQYKLDGYTSYSEYNTTPDGSDFLSALGRYIGENFCTDGSVSGVVIGECENFIGKADGRYESLNDMAKGLALELRRLHSGLASVNSETRVYLSISNLYSNELSASTSEVGADELLPALCSEINLNGSFDWGLCIEDFYRLKDYGDSIVSAVSCNELVTLLRSSGVYDTRMIFSDTNYVFSQLKVTEKLARLVESYYAACFNTHIDAVICTLSGTSSDARLLETVKLIDTSEADDLSKLALSILGYESWKEVIEGFDEKKLRQKTLTTSAALEEEPGGIKGRYGYFRFDSFSGVTGVEPSFYCKSMSIEGSENSILKAVLEPESGTAAWMGVAHRFDYPENMKLTPILEITLGVETARYSDTLGAKLILISGDERYETNIELVPGEMKTVYADISGFTGIEDVESIQVLIEGRAGSSVLRLGGINGLSRDYNDESLESVIAEERAKKRIPDGDDGYRNYIWIGGGVIVGAATVMTVMLLSRKKEEDDE